MANRAFRPEHFGDSSLVAHREYLNRSEGAVLKLATTLSLLIPLILPLIFVLGVTSFIVISEGEGGGVFGALPVLVAILTMATAISLAIRLRDVKEYDQLSAASEAARLSTRKDLELWLRESYGAKLAPEELDEASDLIALGGLEDSMLWSFELSSTAVIEGRLVALPDGSVELRKATVSDTDESIYFKPVLAAL